MNLPSQTWTQRSYEELFEEAVAAELHEVHARHQQGQHDGMHGMMGPVEAVPGIQTVDRVRRLLTELVNTCLLVAQSTFEDFAERCQQLPIMRRTLSQKPDLLLRAAWKAREERDNGLRPLTPSEAQTAARARSLQSLLAKDTTASWAYEGLSVSMRAEGI